MKRMLVQPITAAFLASLFWYSEGALGAQSSQNSHSPVGSWENKDEDGDGVPDEQDDYPFDKAKTRYPLVYEEEFNNNQDVATFIPEIPMRISGVVQQVNDLDFYKIELEANVSVTFLLSSNSAEFEPGMAVLNRNGVAIAAWEPNYKAVGKFKRAIQVEPKDSGQYYLVINDKRLIGKPDFEYQISAFFDSDVDSIDDSIESAFGFSGYSQDTDQDGIYDGEEFYVYKHDDIMLHDMDGDSIPNWLDDDSDGDGIKDEIEGKDDLDRDGYASFVDLDSDGNSVNDSVEVGDDKRHPRNIDSDQFPDYIDLDDDNDLILDVNDQEPNVKVKSEPFQTAGYMELTSLDYLFGGATKISDVHIFEKLHRLSGEGLGAGVLAFERVSGTPENIVVSGGNGTSVDFVLPKDVTKVIFVKDNVRTANEISINPRNQYIPVITDMGPLYLSSSNEIKLHGSGFNEQTVFVLDGRDIAPTTISGSEIVFSLPSDSVSGNLYVKNTYGKSNSVKVVVTSSVNLILEPQVTYSLERVSATSLGGDVNNEFYFNSERELVIPVSNKGYDEVSVFYDDIEALSAIYFGQSEIVLGFDSTAVAKAWQFSKIKKLPYSSNYETLYQKSLNLEEVFNVRRYIVENISDPIKFRSIEFGELVVRAGEAVDKLIDSSGMVI